VKVFALLGMLGLISAAPARAFTVAETLFLPGVQLQASQPVDAFVKISNLTASSVELVVTAIDFKGNVFKSAGTTTTPITLAKNATFKFTVSAPKTGTPNFHTIVEVGTANAVIADLFTVDSSTGAMIAVVPASSTLPQAQFLATAELAPSQKAKIELANATANAVSATVQGIDDGGKVIKTQNLNIAANAGASVTFTAQATKSLSFHAIVNWAAANEGSSDLLTLDKSGNVLAIVPFE
jgi:hypothetical protein